MKISPFKTGLRVGLIGLTISLILQPALAQDTDSGQTNPVSAQEQELAIDECSFVTINGYDQWVTIRGQNLDNPVLVWLHGGPGGSGMSAWAPLFSAWE